MSDEPTNKKERQSWRGATIKRIEKRIGLLDRMLKRFDILAKERAELKSLLAALNGEAVSHIMATNQQQQQQQVAKPQEPPDNTMLHYNPAVNEQALSTDGRVVLNSMPDNFTPDDVSGRLGHNKQKAYAYIASWKNKGWIKTVARGLYTIA